MPRRRDDGSPARQPCKMRLTDRWIGSIVPDLDRVTCVWDERQPGLVLAIQPSGRRTWRFCYRRLGRPVWFTLGCGHAIRVADARRLAAGVALRVAEGGDPRAERRAERGAGTFGELADRYLSEHAMRRNKSWRQADALVRKHLLPRWRNLRADAIARADVRAALGRIERPILANQVLAAASAIFTWGVGQEVVPLNPCQGIERNPTRDRERVLSDSELGLMWSELDPSLKLILLTGARPGEVFGMRREDVRDGMWALAGAPAEGWPGTKNGRSHRVPLSEPALALIDAHLASRSRRRSEVLLQRLWTRLGIERVRPHDLRRSFATIVTRLGFGRQAMDRLLNHSDRSVGSIYDRYSYADEDRRAVEAVARHIARITTGVDDDNVVRLR